MAKIKSAFYAYPSQSADLSQTVEAAAVAITKSRKARIRTWRQLSVPGKLIVTQILDAIDKAEIFACDLTYPNPNVLFELGYATARQKRIWISLNPLIQGAKESFSHLAATLAPDLGYATYTNRNELAQQFLTTQPWMDLSEPLLGSGFSFKAERPSYPALMYLKQPYDTDASVLLSETLRSSSFANGLLTDDPKDNPASTLNWYAQKIRDSDAIIVHLLSSEHTDSNFHNLKCAFVAGLARGFQRQVLMLAPAPYATPLDYRDLLQVHRTAEQCRHIARKWLDDAATKVPQRPPTTLPDGRATSPELSLRNLRLGEYVAEHEHAYLKEYFLETSGFRDALQSEHTIFVGRRGAGKTATLYALEQQIGSRRYNHVCTITPVGYEVDGLVRLLSQNIDLSEKGYLIESLWKFLIYTELANSVVDAYYARPLHEQAQMGAESELVRFVESQPAVFREPFSIRLDMAIAPLLDLGSSGGSPAQRAKISEQLHVGPLKQLRLVLGRTLNARQEVRILLDRLDEPWKPHHNIELLAELLIGLLRVVLDIKQDLRHHDSRRLPVAVNMTVFLRSDIFYHVQRLAPEQDKLPVQFVTWNDPELLVRVLDQRLQSSFNWNFSVDEIWNTLFSSQVDGRNPREFITTWTLGRPRDAIYLTREAVAAAGNRGHSIVTEEDLFAARKRHSEFAFRAVLAEDDPTKGKLEEVLFGFAGVSGQLPYTELRKIIEEAGVSGSDVDFYVDLLSDVNFLGIKSGDEYRYPRDEGERRVLREVARRVAVRSQGEPNEMYEINPAFRDVLQIR